MPEVVNLLLSHQPAGAVARMVNHWSDSVDRESIIVAYGGKLDDFAQIEHERKFFVTDSRLRTRDHQRELQSYTGIFRTAVTFLQNTGTQAQYLHFAEYDHVPLVADLNQRQLGRLHAEGADMLGFHVRRIDGTSHPHFLYHQSNPAFLAHWRNISCRKEPEVVLSMFGSGSFWTWEAFQAVTAQDEKVPCYMEIYLPTTAHHLGFRVRDFGDQDRFVRNLGERSGELEQCRSEGAWTLHPVKHLWS